LRKVSTHGEIFLGALAALAGIASCFRHEPAAQGSLINQLYRSRNALPASDAKD